MTDKKIEKLFNKIEQYLKGEIVTHVTMRYFYELKEIVLQK